MINFRKTVTLLSTLAALSVAFDASAYTRLTCNGTPIKRLSNTVSMSAATAFGTSGVWFDAITRAISLVNSNPSFLGYSMTTGDASVGQGNGQNEIWWVSVDPGGPAVTFTQNNCATGAITESDVVFLNSVSWTTSDNLTSHWSFGGTNRPFATTALHELGHVAGLGHTADTYSIMGTDFTHVHVATNKATPYLGGDASRGLVDIYGAWGIRKDMSVTNMRRTGSSGGYSTHAQTRIRTSALANLPTFTDANGVLGYKVSKGQAVKAEFNFENLGNQWLDNIRFDFYVSADNTIAPPDVNVSAGTLFNQPVGTIYPIDWPITIPSNLTSGSTYYLGIIIDSNNTIAEISESNNSTYIPIRIN